MAQGAPPGGTLALMGISNLHSGTALALGANPADAAAVMRWDLVNPWARFYELNSTHPLTALRVRELNRESAAMHQTSKYELPQNQSVRWGTFPLDFVVWAAPALCIAALLLPFGGFPAPLPILASPCRQRLSRCC